MRMRDTLQPVRAGMTHPAVKAVCVGTSSPGGTSERSPVWSVSVSSCPGVPTYLGTRGAKQTPPPGPEVATLSSTVTLATDTAAATASVKATAPHAAAALPRKRRSRSSATLREAPVKKSPCWKKTAPPFPARAALPVNSAPRSTRSASETHTAPPSVCAEFPAKLPPSTTSPARSQPAMSEAQ